MSSCPRSLGLLTLVLVACSNAGTEADARPAIESVPETLADTGTNTDALPEEQRGYFEDGEVTLAEYQAAYSQFAQCAVDMGVGDDLREQGRDEVTGLITYSTQTMLLPPGQSDGSTLNDCYQRRFAFVEMTFQTSDPAVLAAEPREQLDFFNENFRPCLDSIGIGVPDDLEFNDEHWAQLVGEATQAFQDGRCDSGPEGG